MTSDEERAVISCGETGGKTVEVNGGIAVGDERGEVKVGDEGEA